MNDDSWFVPVLWSYATIAALGIGGVLLSLAGWHLRKWRTRRQKQARAELAAQQAFDELVEGIPLDEICLEPMRIEEFNGFYTELHASVLRELERIR